ncbi:MAG: phosphosulfolactate synthase [Crocinitomicaceae bacterium]|jgi:phosphosulfolactate synthase|nr:phosphosulfolactate synthase [Crocinitomicaceae bacterium]MCF8433821.1 phosphosulfolactate synthase [Crocinitomicaceae bacterium]MDP4637220.1 phosphosulfolactate synthase [Crocinitomicaceae bacterium]MDP4683265.1 phosphosulfolactate synthase [Crocinitomicaceae bacterium]MDP4866759.1 phosphosulfolactate synthase [Crocinitomicaceae bacterium]
MNFELSYIPERSVKPRDKGITMFMDKGLSVGEVKNFIDASGHLTDLVKFGFGTAYVTNDLERKLDMYREAGIRPYFGGTLFEAFYARQKVGDYIKLLDKFKLDLAEISDGSIIINHDEKCELIKSMSQDRTILSEVGSKDSGIMISPAKWIKMMSTELEAGSWKVIAEGREAGNVGVFRPNGTAHTMLINRIIAKVAPEKILWEAPQKNQQVWFIKLFGAEVNLGNIGQNDMIPLECLRLGLRGDTFFDFLPPDYAERLKQVNDEEEVEEEN